MFNERTIFIKSIYSKWYGKLSHDFDEIIKIYRKQFLLLTSCRDRTIVVMKIMIIKQSATKKQIYCILLNWFWSNIVSWAERNVPGITNDQIWIAQRKIAHCWNDRIASTQIPKQFQNKYSMYLNKPRNTLNEEPFLCNWQIVFFSHCFNNLFQFKIKATNVTLKHTHPSWLLLKLEVATNSTEVQMIPTKRSSWIIWTWMFPLDRCKCLSLHKIIQFAGSQSFRLIVLILNPSEIAML